jgi:hypothetical protein
VPPVLMSDMPVLNPMFGMPPGEISVLEFFE